MKFLKSILLIIACTSFVGSYAQTVNYKIIYDSPWLPKHKPVRIYTDLLMLDMIGGSSGMGVGLRAEYFYGKMGTIRLERKMGYLDDKSVTSKHYVKEGLKNYSFSDLGLSYNFRVKTKKVPVEVIISSKKSEGKKYTTFENQQYLIEGTSGKVRSLRTGFIRYRFPTAFDLTSESWMTYGSGIYLGLSSYSAINVWAESDFGMGGFRNRMGIYADMIASLKTTRNDIYPDKSEREMSRGGFGFRAGILFDGVSDKRRPNLGFLSTKLEMGLFPGNDSRFYLSMSSGLCFDAGWKRMSGNKK